MFEELRRAWQQAVDNFQRELHGGEGAGATADARVIAMRREVATARRQVRRLELERSRLTRELQTALREEEVCRRREEMARRIQDDETARIAAQFALRHEEEAGILRRKVEILDAEHGLRTRQLGEMEESLATIAPAGLDRGDGAPPLERERDRSDEPVGEQKDRAFRDLEEQAREREAEARLEELKKRMR